MIYRTNFKEENKSSLSEKDIVHDLTDNWKPDFIRLKNQNCPFCNSKFSDEFDLDNLKIYLCVPAKRYYKGLFWWKKTCSITGMHTHYICKTCKYHWIYRKTIPNNPISEI